MSSEPFGDVLAKVGAIGTGLAIGTAAKYGIALTDGRRLTWTGVLADMLLLGMLGLLAIVIADSMNLSGNARVLCGALAAVSSDRLIRLARDRFFKAVDGQMARLIPDADREAILHIPAGAGEPDEIGLQIIPLDTPAARLQANLRRSYGKADQGHLPSDQIEQLRRLDRD